MKWLKKLDEVAYIRFASVYRSFKDVKTFYRELDKLAKRHGRTKKGKMVGKK
jgi:transcriptional repressor NrdR